MSKLSFKKFNKIKQGHEKFHNETIIKKTQNDIKKLINSEHNFKMGYIIPDVCSEIDDRFPELFIVEPWQSYSMHLKKKITISSIDIVEFYSYAFKKKKHNVQKQQKLLYKYILTGQKMDIFDQVNINIKDNENIFDILTQQISESNKKYIINIKTKENRKLSTVIICNLTKKQKNKKSIDALSCNLYMSYTEYFQLSNSQKYYWDYFINHFGKNLAKKLQCIPDPTINHVFFVYKFFIYKFLYIVQKNIVHVQNNIETKKKT